MTRRGQTAGSRRDFTTRAGRTLSFTALGFGGAEMGNYLQPVSDESCAATLEAAWEAGVRYFDTAPFYGLGLSELRIGRMLATRPRDEFVLGTKVGRVLDPCEPGEENGILFVDTPQVKFTYDYSYDGVMRSYHDSLDRLGVNGVDILYVHDVDALVHGSDEAARERIRELVDDGGWRALEELRSSGEVAALGVGVNQWEACARMLDVADPDLFLLAGRYTLLEQEPLTTLFPRCAERGVGIVVGGPYNSGILAGGGTYNYADAPADIVARVERITAVCGRHGVDISEAALQFVLGHPLVVTVIPGSKNIDEMQANVAKLDARIPAALWDELRAEGLIDADAPTPA